MEQMNGLIDMLVITFIMGGIVGAVIALHLKAKTGKAVVEKKDSSVH